MWLLKMCKITATKVTKLDAKDYIPMWLVLPRCTPATTEEHLTWVQVREDKAGAATQAVKQAMGQQCWYQDSDRAIVRVKHQELTGRTQQGRDGLGKGQKVLIKSIQERREAVGGHRCDKNGGQILKVKPWGNPEAM